LLGLLFLLAPVLQPFFIALALAYLGNPVVSGLERIKFPRTLAVSFVFVLFALVITVVVLVLVPILQKQFLQFWQQLPNALLWFESSVVPFVSSWFGVSPDIFHLSYAKGVLAGHLDEVKSLMPAVYSALSRSSSAIVSTITFLFLIPVVTFYLLRDWGKLLQGVKEVLPGKLRVRVCLLAVECDSVLSAFMRGQLSVMCLLAGIYACGLWFVGVQFALLLGLLAGLASIVPYLGLIVGLSVSSVAALIQFQEFSVLGWVVLVFAVGQLIEAVALTPLLVGDKIGLHPVAVIFAILAGGFLFGFVGVLVALPAAAVIAVLLRHFHEHYLADGGRG